MAFEHKVGVSIKYAVVFEKFLICHYAVIRKPVLNPKSSMISLIEL